MRPKAVMGLLTNPDYSPQLRLAQDQLVIGILGPIASNTVEKNLGLVANEAVGFSHLRCHVVHICKERFGMSGRRACSLVGRHNSRLFVLLSYRCARPGCSPFDRLRSPRSPGRSLPWCSLRMDHGEPPARGSGHLRV